MTDSTVSHLMTSEIEVGQRLTAYTVEEQYEGTVVSISESGRVKLKVDEGYGDSPYISFYPDQVEWEAL